MGELPSVEGDQINGGFIPPEIITSVEPPETSAAVSVGSKRLRRPSVRLGEIGGDQYHQHVASAYDSPHVRRPKWRPSVSNIKDPKTNQSCGKSSSSRTRTLTNLSSSAYGNIGTLDEDPIAVGSWRVKKWVKSSGAETATTAASAAKRVRTSWAVTKTDGVEQGDEKFSGGEEEEEEKDEEEEEEEEEKDEEEEEEEFRDFSKEDSESPMKEQTQENRKKYEIELSGDWQSGGRGREGVKIWLQELGLGRYWPMFEMHEVDDQVLPLLTVEDLKDMGINAVGSRRKMYCAIQKLGREFS